MADMQQFLYTTHLVRPGMLRDGPTAKEQATVTRHFNYLKALAAQGVVLLAGRTQTTDEHTFGICILQAESEDAVRRVMENDPAVLGRVMRATLYPYRMAIVGKISRRRGRRRATRS
ncbi:MAG: YciI family protein [Armatimonadota bacterium]|nr:YciI family protein [Armatimonadota bacterium]